MAESRLPAETWTATSNRLAEMARGSLNGSTARDIEAEDVAQECAVRLWEKRLAAGGAGPEGLHGGTLRLYVRNVTFEKLDQRKRRGVDALTVVDEIEALPAHPEDESGWEALLAAPGEYLVCLTVAQERATLLLGQLGSFDLVAEKEHITRRAAARRLGAAERRGLAYQEHPPDVAHLAPDLPASEHMLALRRAGWTHRALASKFRKTVGAVKQALFRARHRNSDAA